MPEIVGDRIHNSAGAWIERHRVLLELGVKVTEYRIRLKVFLAMQDTSCESTLLSLLEVSTFRVQGDRPNGREAPLGRQSPHARYGTVGLCGQRQEACS